MADYIYRRNDKDSEIALVSHVQQEPVSLINGDLIDTQRRMAEAQPTFKRAPTQVQRTRQTHQILRGAEPRAPETAIQLIG